MGNAVSSWHFHGAAAHSVLLQWRKWQQETISQVVFLCVLSGTFAGAGAAEMAGICVNGTAQERARYLGSLRADGYQKEILFHGRSYAGGNASETAAKCTAKVGKTGAKRTDNCNRDCNRDFAFVSSSSSILYKRESGETDKILPYTQRRPRFHNRYDRSADSSYLGSVCSDSERRKETVCPPTGTLHCAGGTVDRDGIHYFAGNHEVFLK